MSNDKGFIGQIRTTLSASSFAEAEQVAYRALAPTLSHWATYFDVPVTIARVEATEVQYGSQHMRVINPYDELPFRITGDEPLSVELRAFESYYREGVNSNTPAYQFVCFFKVIEGVTTYRVRVARQRKKAGLGEPPPLGIAERVPSDRTHFVAWLDALFPLRTRPWDDMALEAIFIDEVVGRTVEELVRNQSRANDPGPIRQLRNDISHSLWVEGLPSLSADEAMHIRRVERWLPVTKCIARLLLLNDFPGQLWGSRRATQ